MRFWEKVKSRNYWISTLVMVVAILLLEKTTSNFISKYIGNVPLWLLSFLAIFIILLISRLLSESILEV